jgi:N-acyl-D-aspartate/D-glutamate deacylase
VSDWDIVLRGGRVIDPESGLDEVRDVAISDGRVAGIGTGLGSARAELDVSAMVVTAVSDQATYAASTRPSTGIRHVLVNGTIVVQDGAIVADALPGRPVRASPR